MEQVQEFTYRWENLVFPSARVENLIIQRESQSTQKGIASAGHKINRRLKAYLVLLNKVSQYFQITKLYLEQSLG